MSKFPHPAHPQTPAHRGLRVSGVGVLHVSSKSPAPPDSRCIDPPWEKTFLQESSGGYRPVDLVSQIQNRPDRRPARRKLSCRKVSAPAPGRLHSALQLTAQTGGFAMSNAQ
jgi:hypothetical protein